MLYTQSYLDLILGILLVICGFKIAFSENFVEAIISLVISFAIGGIILFYYGLDFLGLTYIIIYVGAVAVLFIFIIMMYSLKYSVSETTNVYNTVFEEFLDIFHICFYFIIIYLYLDLQTDLFQPLTNLSKINLLDSPFIIDLDVDILDIESYGRSLSNFELFGQYFFNYYTSCFLIAGLILLVALIGSIIITLNLSKRSKNQYILNKQLTRTDNFISFYLKFEQLVK